MKSLTILALLLLFTHPAFSQQRWERTYGGTGYDVGKSVQQTSDGGYVVAGWTNSFGHGSYDVYLIKTNAFGDTLWTRTYGGMGADAGYTAQLTQDGGYIIVGETRSFGDTIGDVYLIKTDAYGDTLWTRTYGGPAYDAGWSVRQTTDGGFVISGWTKSFGSGQSDVWLIKTNAAGDTLWARTYGGANRDEGYIVRQTQDSGFVLTGCTFSYGPGGGDVWLIKTNPSGDTLWTRTYGGSGMDDGQAVQQTQDGGYIIVGGTTSFGAGDYDVYLIKTDANGDTLWTRTYGGLYFDRGWAVQQTQEGGYIIVGTTNSFGHGGYDVYLLKTNSFGDTLWTKTLGGDSSDYGYSIQQTQDGGYIIAGYTASFGAGGMDVYLIKADANGNVGVEKTGSRGQRSGIRITAKPNPFSSFTTVPGHEGERFNLYDIAGRKVGSYRGDRIGDGQAPGVYFIRPDAGHINTLRVVKLR